MSIQEHEAARIRERVLSLLESRLGNEYGITVGWPKVSDSVKLVVDFQVLPESGRLTPMEIRYLELCERRKDIKAEWLNTEVKMDGQLLTITGVANRNTASKFNIVLASKFNPGGGYYLSPQQLVTIVSKQEESE